MSGAEKLVKNVTEALDDRKGVEIVSIDLRKIENCFCSFFVICHGTSNSHVASLAENVQEKARIELGEKPLHTEGEQQGQWVVLDYGDVVVHIFQKELRDYYQLEDFWVDAEITNVEENIFK